jgi:hypothetical protein
LDAAVLNVVGLNPQYRQSAADGGAEQNGAYDAVKVRSGYDAIHGLVSLDGHLVLAMCTPL